MGQVVQIASDSVPARADGAMPGGGGLRCSIPLQPLGLVGRDRDVQAACDLLRDPGVRLLTITGPPGVGKTRLAVEVASQIARQFEDGAVFVDLAPVRDPSLVPHAIAHGLEVPDRANSPAIEQLQFLLRDEHRLLVLDNFEQVIEAAPQIVHLLSHCPDVKVLATSREALRLRWEHEYALAPLETPDPARLARPEAALRYPAVALFAQRARAVQPGFSVDAGNGRSVAGICRRLDGLPLAIELAAPRIKLFPPEALLSRLDHGLELLTSGARDAVERHRTLEAAIAWSYDLLTPSEQCVLRRLGLFTGGFTLEAARVIVTGIQADVFAVIASLVDKSLLLRVAQADGEPRFRMLETIREFGLEQLVSAGEYDDGRRRHATFFAVMVQQAEPALQNAGVATPVARLDPEADNIRAALDWAQRHDAQMSLRMAGTLGRFWALRGFLAEGRERVRIAIASGRGSADRAALADALYAEAMLSRNQGDYAAAVTSLEECRDIRRALGDERGTVLALAYIGHLTYNVGDCVSARRILEEAMGLARECGDPEALTQALNGLGAVKQRQGELEAAGACFREALAVATEAGNLRGVASLLTNLGSVARDLGDYQTARRYHERSVQIWRQIGDRLYLPLVLNNLGNALRELGEVAAARAAYEESLSTARETGDRRVVGFALNGLGSLARDRSDLGEAARIYSEALQIRHDLGEKLEIARTMENMARLAIAHSHPIPAVSLAGAATTIRQAIGAATQPEDSPLHNGLATARRTLGERAYASAWGAGVAMSVDRAADYALAWAARLAKKPAHREKLSRRETEVAALITCGLTNRQIAMELFISERTADTHVQHILNKLGFSSRAQIAAWTARGRPDTTTH